MATSRSMGPKKKAKIIVKPKISIAAVRSRPANRDSQPFEIQPAI